MAEKTQALLDELSSSPSQVSDAHPGMASENSALAQAIVADQGFISALFSSILENICPELFKSLHSSTSAKVPMGQEAYPRTEVPLGRKVLSSATPVGQAESNSKRSLTEGRTVQASTYSRLAPSVLLGRQQG